MVAAPSRLPNDPVAVQPLRPRAFSQRSNSITDCSRRTSIKKKEFGQWESSSVAPWTRRWSAGCHLHASSPSTLQSTSAPTSRVLPAVTTAIQIPFPTGRTPTIIKKFRSTLPRAYERARALVGPVAGPEKGVERGGRCWGCMRGGRRFSCYDREGFLWRQQCPARPTGSEY